MDNDIWINAATMLIAVSGTISDLFWIVAISVVFTVNMPVWKIQLQ